MTRSPIARRVLLAVLALVPWLAAGPPAFAEATPDDPVVADVVRMLDAGLEPELILGWLESGKKRPGPLSASDMIALTAAEAPPELIEELLARAARDAQPATDPLQHDASQPANAVVAAGDCCLVDFSVEYRAPENSTDEYADTTRADLYLYLDGQFLGRYAARGEIADEGLKVNKYRIAPGQHTIRLTREQHLPSKNKDAADARDHLTWVSPSSIDFELVPGAQWSMEIHWTQGVFSQKRPLSWRWSRNGEPVAGEERVGAFQDDWPFLCEDIEVSRSSGAIASWRATDRSRDCVSWASLWPQGIDSNRKQILAEFESTGFQPGVKPLD